MSTPFFNSFEEMKPYLGSAFSSFDILVLESVGNNSLRELGLMMGMPLINDLKTKFDDNSTSTLEDDIINALRKPLANMMFYKHSNQGTLYISDSGYTTLEGENSKKPYQWMIRNFQIQCLSDYANGMDDLFEILYTNKASLSLWTNSDEYKYAMSMPICKTKQWHTAGRRINNWRTHYALQPEQGMVWTDIAKYISADLRDLIKTQLLAGTLNTDNTALLPYLQRYVAHATIQRAANVLPIQIDADGLLIKEVIAGNSNSDEVKQESNRALLQKQAQEEAKTALCQLQTYLNENATASKYVGYYVKFLQTPAETVTINKDGDKLIMM